MRERLDQGIRVSDEERLAYFKHDQDEVIRSMGEDPDELRREQEIAAQAPDVTLRDGRVVKAIWERTSTGVNRWITDPDEWEKANARANDPYWGMPPDVRARIEAADRARQAAK